MEVENVTIDPNNPDVVEWTIPRMTRSQVAQYRKILFEEIPTWSIDAVEIFINESVMLDEIVSLHLGLLPVLELPRNSTGIIYPGMSGHWSDVSAELGVESGSFELTVTSSMIKTEAKLYPNIPLLILPPHSRFAAKMYLQYGCGRTHAKWSPVSVVLPMKTPNGYRFRAELRRNISPSDLIAVSLKLWHSQIQNSFPS